MGSHARRLPGQHHCAIRRGARKVCPCDWGRILYYCRSFDEIIEGLRGLE